MEPHPYSAVFFDWGPDSSKYMLTSITGLLSSISGKL
jgi:hypothetical protein